MAMCRACGEYPGDHNRLRENLQKYFDIYFNLTSIRLPPDEDPDRQRICDDCHLKLLEYNRFRTVCLQVHFRLTETVIKTEVDYDHSGLVTVECKPLVGPLKVENLDPPEDDLEEVAPKNNIFNADDDDDDDDSNEEDDDDDDDDDDYIEVETTIIKDEGSDQLSDNDQGYKQPKKQKTKKKKKRGDGPKEELLGCHLCEKKFRTNERLQGHLRTHQGLKAALCNLCGREFHKFYSLKQHMKRKHSDAKNEFICDFPDCGSSYSTKQGLTNHRKRHDPNYIPAEPKRVVCDQCGKTFSTAGALKKHNYIHSGDMPFQCQVCNKKLPTAHKLKEHTMRHEGVRNHVCPYCGLKKTTRHELKVHMNYHTKEKQFTCHVCAQVFSNIGNMSRHIKIVHCGIKAYNCTYCDRSFGKAETLKHHVMTHTGEKPHECKVCGKRFIQMVALQTHMKTHRKYELKQEAQHQSTATSHLLQPVPPILAQQQQQQHSVSLLQAAAAAVAAAPMVVALAHPQQQQQHQQHESPLGSPSMGGYHVNHSV